MPESNTALVALGLRVRVLYFTELDYTRADAERPRLSRRRSTKCLGLAVPLRIRVHLWEADAEPEQAGCAAETSVARVAHVASGETVASPRS